ncbi:MAG: large conductance mechanosensitive channel protein MscL [Candidatus Paceibacteria bacterium]
MLKEFKQFLLRGNAVDLAIGVTVGAAFGAVVSALVADVLTPLIAAVAKVPDFGGLVFTINGSRFMYGHLINAVVSFILVSFAVFFFVVKPKGVLLSRTTQQPNTKTCPECLSEIPSGARRCMYCTQVLVKN